MVAGPEATSGVNWSTLVQLVAALVYFLELALSGARWMYRKRRKVRVKRRRMFTVRRTLIIGGLVVTAALVFVTALEWKIGLVVALAASAIAVVVLDYRAETVPSTDTRSRDPEQPDDTRGIVSQPSPERADV